MIGRAPGEGAQAGGTKVTITGSGFADGATVTFGADPARRVTVESSTRITAVTPAGRSARSRRGAESRLPSRSSTMASPTWRRRRSRAVGRQGPIDGGTKVTITGSGFGPDAVVGVGNVVLDDAKVVNESTITLVMPPAASSIKVDISVTNPGEPRALAKRAFTYTARHPSRSLSPPPTPTRPGAATLSHRLGGHHHRRGRVRPRAGPGGPVPVVPPASPVPGSGMRSSSRTRGRVDWIDPVAVGSAGDHLADPCRGRARRHDRLHLHGEQLQRPGPRDGRRGLPLTVGRPAHLSRLVRLAYTPGDKQLTSMTESDDVRDAYDVAAIQERWLPVWDELAPFRSGRPDDDRPEEVRPRHVPVPVGRPAHGSRRGVRAR